MTETTGIRTHSDAYTLWLPKPLTIHRDHLVNGMILSLEPFGHGTHPDQRSDCTANEARYMMIESEPWTYTKVTDMITDTETGLVELYFADCPWSHARHPSVVLTEDETVTVSGITDGTSTLRANPLFAKMFWLLGHDENIDVTLWHWDCCDGIPTWISQSGQRRQSFAPTDWLSPAIHPEYNSVIAGPLAEIIAEALARPVH